eukprot:5127-Heterococcus_DN1.PRE.2
MRAAEIGPDSVHYATAAAALGAAKDWWGALLLLEFMEEEGISPCIDTYTAAMEACAGAGRWRQALRLFDIIEQDPEMEATPKALCAALCACAKGGIVERAVSLLRRLAEITTRSVSAALLCIQLLCELYCDVLHSAAYVMCFMYCCLIDCAYTLCQCALHAYGAARTVVHGAA